jgi:hypothetical protein
MRIITRISPFPSCPLRNHYHDNGSKALVLFLMSQIRSKKQGTFADDASGIRATGDALALQAFLIFY